MSSDKVFGECKLCKKSDYLCNSHIIPKFFFKRTLLNKEVIIATGNDLMNNQNIKHQRNSFNGFYQNDMLCKECDELIIGKYDDYIAKFIYSDFLPKNWNIKSNLDKEKDVIDFINIDYKKYKLFFLSLIWRAHHSKCKFFRQVDLGVYEEAIRKMILSKEPGSANSYPIIPVVGKYKNHDETAFLLEFSKFKLKEKYTVYKMPFMGFYFFIIIKDKVYNKEITAMSIQENGQLRIKMISKQEMSDLNLQHIGIK